MYCFNYLEFIDISASQTGNVVAAITENRLYVNINTGGGINGTWQLLTPPTSTSEVDLDFNPWTAVSVSADGNRIVAVPELGFVLFSDFPFTSWSTIDLASTGSRRKTWQDIVFTGGYDLIGLLWDGRMLSYAETWSGPSNPLETNVDDVVIASSASGEKLIAALYYGSVWMSDNNGTTWIKQSVGAEEEQWLAVAISADGTHAVAVVEDGYIPWHDVY